MWLGVIAIFLATLIAVKFLFGSKAKRKTIDSIPGMKPSHSEYGNTLEIKKAKSLGHFLCDLHKQYGPIASFWEGKKHSISLASPHLFKQIRHLYLTTSKIFEEFKVYTGDQGLGYVDIEEVRRRRKFYDQHFMLKACKSYSNTFSEIANEFINKWEKLDKDDRVPLIHETALASIAALSRTTYGDVFKDEKALLRFQELNNYIFLNLLPMPPKDGPVYKHVLENIRELREMVKEALETRKKAKKDDGERLFIDVVLEEDFTDEQRISEGLVMIGAGYRTSSAHVAWTLYHLCKNPDIQEKLYEHLVANLGDQPVTLEVIPNLSYLKQVLDEGLRFFNINGIAGRITHEDMYIDDYFIPKDTTVYMAFGYLNQDSKNYPNPEQFNPENFSEASIRARHPFTFKPFGFAGKRQCLGQTFAMSESSIFIAEWCRRFRFRLVPNVNDEVEITGAFVPNAEVYVNIEKR